MDFTKDVKNYIDKEYQVLNSISGDEINSFAEKLIEVYKKGGNIFIFGNGGSAAAASHFAVDFNKGVSENLVNKFHFICLNDNIPTLTAIANDIGYEYVFELQLKNLMKPGDMVIGLSGSGNSKNIVRAIEYAKNNGACTAGITGYSGGKVREISDINIWVPADDMQISEDAHIILCHAFMKILKDHLEKNNI